LVFALFLILVRLLLGVAVVAAVLWLLLQAGQHLAK
jgi:hypothetical protein